jgi:hemolysin III
MKRFDMMARHVKPRLLEPIDLQPKPLLRGWLHGISAVAAIVTTIGFLFQVKGDIARGVSLAIFGLSMTVLFIVSTIYHRGDWTGRRETLIRAIDHANIFVFIAGAYTPMCVIVLTGWVQTALLAIVWTLAILGVVFCFTTLHLPRWSMITLYMGMGWLSVVLLPFVAQAISLTPVLWLLAGGALFTVGALIYALHWPNPFPRLFGYHELFHLLVVAGIAITTATIWFWIVPFVPQAAG